MISQILVSSFTSKTQKPPDQSGEFNEDYENFEGHTSSYLLQNYNIHSSQYPDNPFKQFPSENFKKQELAFVIRDLSFDNINDTMYHYHKFYLFAGMPKSLTPILNEEIESCKVIKQGYADKLSDRVLIGWQKRYIMLYDTKLYYMRSPIERSEILGSINFLYYDCYLKLVDKKDIIICYKCIDHEFTFRVKDSEEQESWIKNMLMAIKKTNKMKKHISQLSLKEKQKYFKKDIMNEFQFKLKCSTGDLVFITFQKNNDGFFSGNALQLICMIYKFEKNCVFLVIGRNLGDLQFIEFKYQQKYIKQQHSVTIFIRIGYRELNFIRKHDIQLQLDNIFHKSENIIRNNEEFLQFCNENNINENNQTPLIIELFRQNKILTNNPRIIQSIIFMIELPDLTQQKNYLNGAWLSHLAYII